MLNMVIKKLPRNKIDDSIKRAEALKTSASFFINKKKFNEKRQFLIIVL